MDFAWAILNPSNANSPLSSLFSNTLFSLLSFSMRMLPTRHTHATDVWHSIRLDRLWCSFQSVSNSKSFIIEAFRNGSWALWDWISHWNGIRIHVAKVPSNRRKWDESNRTEGPNNYRIEDSRFFMRSPSKVSYRCWPKLRSWHDGFDCQGLIKLAEMSFMCSRWGNWNPTAREAKLQATNYTIRVRPKRDFVAWNPSSK